MNRPKILVVDDELQIRRLLGNTLAQVEKAYAKWAPGFGTAAVGHLGAMVPLALVAGEG